MKYFFQIAGRLTPVIISLILLAAHFSRKHETVLVILSVALLGVLFIRRHQAARLLQAVLLLGGVEWVASMINYINVRKALGDDWVRLAVILTAVALFTALSGLVFFSKRLKEHYRIK